MNMIARLLGSTRIGLLVFLLPPAVLWMLGVAGSGEDPPVFGGVVLTLGFLGLAVLHAVLFDIRTIRSGTRARLALTRDIGGWSDEVVERWALILSGLILLAALLLIGVRVSATLLLLVLTGCVWLLTRGLTLRSRRWRLIFVEVIWPLAMLIAPMMVIGGMLLGEDGSFDGRAVQGTALFGLALAAHILLCLLRDQPLDGSEGVRTAVTLLGRTGGLALLFIVLSVFSLLAIRSVDEGLWHWGVAVIGVIGGMATLLLVAVEDEDVAPGLWALTCTVSGIFLVASGG